QCSGVLGSLHFETEQQLKDALGEEQDRLYPALDDFEALSRELLRVSDYWDARWTAHEAGRPFGAVGRKLRLPPMSARGTDGAYSVSMGKRPRQRPLGPERCESLRAATESTTAELPILLARVQRDGSVVIDPVEPTAVPD